MEQIWKIKTSSLGKCNRTKKAWLEVGEEEEWFEKTTGGGDKSIELKGRAEEYFQCSIIVHWSGVQLI